MPISDPYRIVPVCITRRAPHIRSSFVSSRLSSCSASPWIRSVASGTHRRSCIRACLAVTAHHIHSFLISTRLWHSHRTCIACTRNGSTARLRSSFILQAEDSIQSASQTRGRNALTCTVLQANPYARKKQKKRGWNQTQQAETPEKNNQRIKAQIVVMHGQVAPRKLRKKGRQMDQRAKQEDAKLSSATALCCLGRLSCQCSQLEEGLNSAAENISRAIV